MFFVVSRHISYYQPKRLLTTAMATSNSTTIAQEKIKKFSKARNVEIIHEIFEKLCIKSVNPGIYDGSWKSGSGSLVTSFDPSTNDPIAKVQTATIEDLKVTLLEMNKSKLVWREMPAPKRGEIVRQIREKLSENIQILGKLVSLETGKLLVEGIGEIQEYLDVCDYAVGLSRMLNGQVIPSERPGHLMLERWNPLGIVSVISAFNFPAAVYGWNSAIALVCGNAVLWKGSPSTNLTSIAIIRLVSSVFEKNGLPGSICSLVTGGAEVGEAIVQSEMVDLVSFTGISFCTTDL